MDKILLKDECNIAPFKLSYFILILQQLIQI